MKNIKSTSEWEFGEFLAEEAEELIAKAKQNGLNISRIEMEFAGDLSETSYVKSSDIIENKFPEEALP